MKLLPVLVSVVAMIGLAVPAHAEPLSNDASLLASNDKSFLAALDHAGITYQGGGRAISAGQTVCQLMDDGQQGIDVITNVQKFNPASTLDAAAKFAAIATSVYCPQHLKQG